MSKFYHAYKVGCFCALFVASYSVCEHEVETQHSADANVQNILVRYDSQHIMPRIQRIREELAHCNDRQDGVVLSADHERVKDLERELNILVYTYFESLDPVIRTNLFRTICSRDQFFHSKDSVSA